MNVCEIFKSIQGESTLQGIPTVFVRLAGCNLDCLYCDTKYAREDGEIMSIESIIQHVQQFNIKYVCITGGEPLLQKDTPLLASVLNDLEYFVSVETNGSINATILPDSVIRVIDIKTPGSGQQGTTNENNIVNTRHTDEFKFVITDRNDFDYSVRFATKILIADSVTVLFAPAYEMLDPATLSEWILNDFPQARLNLQLHKYIWPFDIGTRNSR